MSNELVEYAEDTAHSPEAAVKAAREYASGAFYIRWDTASHEEKAAWCRAAAAFLTNLADCFEGR